MRITSKGQVTIPKPIRDRLGLVPDSEVEFEIDGDAVRVRRARTGEGRGEALVRLMTGKGTTRMTTEEIMALTRGDE